MLPNSTNQRTEEEAYEYIEQRFGIRKEELNFEIKKINGDFWALTGSELQDFSFETRGIRLLRDMKIGLKPTTYAVQILQNKIRKNNIDLDEEELKAILNREMISRSLEEKGYVALSFKGDVIGCGLYKDNLISSRIPKGRSNELKKAVDID